MGLARFEAPGSLQEMSSRELGAQGWRSEEGSELLEMEPWRSSASRRSLEQAAHTRVGVELTPAQVFVFDHHRGSFI